MDPSVLGQYVANGLMLGVIYAMVAVGFTLFFGVLDVIKFSHGDVLMVGAFAGLATFIGVRALGIDSAWLQLAAVVIVATASTAVLGATIGKVLVLPLRAAAHPAARHAHAGPRAAAARAPLLSAAPDPEAFPAPIAPPLACAPLLP